MKQYPSIFNDVIGPVMVGPSSSHTAASVRIGRLLRQLAGEDGAIREIVFSFDHESSLATTYNTQGADIGLLGGLLGRETHAADLPQAYALARASGLDFRFEVRDIGPGHPNAYYCRLRTESDAEYSLCALSVGGGMIEISAYQGFPISISGGFYELLLELADKAAEAAESLRGLLPGAEQELIRDAAGRALFHAWSDQELPRAEICAQFPRARFLQPVLPVRAQLKPSVPMISAQQIADYAAENGKRLWQAAADYESARSGLSEQQVLDKMIGLIRLLRASLDANQGKRYADRILPEQSPLLLGKDLLGGGLMQGMLYYISRFMEIKSGMGVFVAAPTAGSCGCLSGTVFALSEQLALSDARMAELMLAAGLVGVLIAHKGTFAAEEGGCQAECGSGSGMCAAACAEALGASAAQCLDATAMALQNIFGLTCDPVANRVEAPCLGKNIMCALNAMAAANMAYAGYDAVVPLDETIIAMDKVGRMLPRELRCTGLGGLSLTPAAQAIRRRLEQERQ